MNFHLFSFSSLLFHDLCDLEKPKCLTEKRGEKGREVINAATEPSQGCRNLAYCGHSDGPYVFPGILGTMRKMEGCLKRRGSEGLVRFWVTWSWEYLPWFSLGSVLVCKVLVASFKMMAPLFPAPTPPPGKLEARGMAGWGRKIPCWHPWVILGAEHNYTPRACVFCSWICRKSSIWKVGAVESLMMWQGSATSGLSLSNADLLSLG